MSDDATNLLKRAIDGDELALTLLLQRMRGDLVAWLTCHIPGAFASQVDAEGAVQDAHVEAFRNIGRLRAESLTDFDRWLRTIAIHKLRDQLKRARAAKRGGGQTPVTGSARAVDYEDSMVGLFELVASGGRTPSRSVARLEVIAGVQQALAGLPEQYREAIRLVHVEGRSAADAARLLGRTERGVHGLVRRGMAELRRGLGDLERFLSRK